MKIKDLCESERPREKLLAAGCGGLSNGELLAIILRSGNREHSAIELAQLLLKEAEGQLCKLSNMSVERLASVPGIGEGKAATILAAMELGRRFMHEESGAVKKAIATPRAVYEIMLPEMKGLMHEECWIIMLNTSGYLLKKQQISRGGYSATVIDHRQIIRLALETHASGIILVHNHPSGNPVPSEMDRKQTMMLKKAAEQFGIALMDHLIFCNDCYFSFADEGITDC